MSKFDIFLSYQWEIQDKVKELCRQLTLSGLKVWMDIYQLAGGNLHTEIVNGISNSKIFVCCITKKYSESKNCENELCFAYDSNQKIIAIMFEKVTLGDLMGVGLMLARLLRINAFDDERFPFNAESERFLELLTALTPDKPISTKSSSIKFLKNASISKQNSEQKKDDEKVNGLENTEKNQKNPEQLSDLSSLYQSVYHQNSVFFPNVQQSTSFYSNYGSNFNPAYQQQFSPGQSETILASIKDKFKSLTSKNSTGTSPQVNNSSELYPYYNYNPYQYPRTNF
ncbi:hypothetical protein BpHYR1_035138 [Brachionus plicatilis]|uniref:TIR domain-containing protein n=1 Tax=Brachionus plicatilis TaxID=10195 RepID=A0A3M7SE65_BRAPC|nr:hypothetical protein BpHYR1_035138 [Brachionus plicatilis]